MNHPHRGVLLPPPVATASEAEKDAYAAETKRINGLFCDAVFALEDRAMELGLDPRELFDRG